MSIGSQLAYIPISMTWRTAFRKKTHLRMVQVNNEIELIFTHSSAALFQKLCVWIDAEATQSLSKCMVNQSIEHVLKNRMHHSRQTLQKLFPSKVAELCLLYIFSGDASDTSWQNLVTYHPYQLRTDRTHAPISNTRTRREEAVCAHICHGTSFRTYHRLAVFCGRKRKLVYCHNGNDPGT